MLLLSVMRQNDEQYMIFMTKIQFFVDDKEFNVHVRFDIFPYICSGLLKGITY